MLPLVTLVKLKKRYILYHIRDRVPKISSCDFNFVSLQEICKN